MSNEVKTVTVVVQANTVPNLEALACNLFVTVNNRANVLLVILVSEKEPELNVPRLKELYENLVVLRYKEGQTKAELLEKLATKFQGYMLFPSSPITFGTNNWDLTLNSLFLETVAQAFPCKSNVTMCEDNVFLDTTRTKTLVGMDKMSLRPIGTLITVAGKSVPIPVAPQEPLPPVAEVQEEAEEPKEPFNK